MEWLYVWMPIVGIQVFWPGLVILGLGVGIVGGFFGMGGAWMVTPGLNILGFPMAFAIGTDIAHMSGKSLISTMRHAKFGNVDYKLGLIMVFGTVTGVECGSRIVMWLERLGRVEQYVRYGYMVLLTVIACLVFADIREKRRKDQEARAAGRAVDALSTGLELHKKLQRLSLPPVIFFSKSGVRCSIWLPIGIALFTGLLAGFLGIGGGLICMPALIYLVGCPTHVAVGTDLFGVMISGLYGAATYSYKGRVDLVAVFIMLIGAAVGAQIGTVATKYVKGYAIRVYFGLTVAGCGISVLLKLLGAAYGGRKYATDIAAVVLILGLVMALSLVIVVKFLNGVREERRARKAEMAHV